MPCIDPDAYTTPEPPKQLSARALNVLKELTDSLTGESPAKGTEGRWTPSDDLLGKLTFKCLATARNCGPQTIDEIVAWAASKGVTLRPPFHRGKSLAAMWLELAARFSANEFSQVEFAQALEKSIRRRNTRIPVAFQQALLRILSTSDTLPRTPRPEEPPAG